MKATVHINKPGDRGFVAPFDGTEEEAKTLADQIAAEGFKVNIDETRPEGTNRGVWIPRRFVRWPGANRPPDVA